MATVQAKFRCVAKTERASAYGPPDCVAAGVEIELEPVLGAGNEQWSRYTPSGSLNMVITNPDACAAFEIGKDYLVTFESAPAE